MSSALEQGPPKKDSINMQPRLCGFEMHFYER